MDFITHLPTTKQGHDTVTTIVDKLTQRDHRVHYNTSDVAETVADIFSNNVFKLRGLPDSLVSNRDPKFASQFWKQLTTLCDIRLKMSTSRHPQTVGATEIMNRMVSDFLRCYCDQNQRS